MTSRERISLPGGDFELLTEGDPDPQSPVALCLHGFPDHAPSFTRLLGALADAGYRAVAPWLRGYAPSTLAGPFDLERLVTDVRELADALSPDRPIALIGHDWGAVITYEAAARWPDRIASAVTLAIPHPSGFLTDIPEHPAQLRRSWYMLLFQLPLVAEYAVERDDHALIDKLWRDWSPGYAPPPAYMRALKDCLTRSMPAPINYYRAFLRPVGQVIQRMRAGALPEHRIRIPLLCLMGEQDGCVGAELGQHDARFFVGRYERQVVPGVGHFMQLEAPEEIARRVLGWIQRHDE